MEFESDVARVNHFKTWDTGMIEKRNYLFLLIMLKVESNQSFTWYEFKAKFNHQSAVANQAGMTGLMGTYRGQLQGRCLK